MHRDDPGEMVRGEAWDFPSSVSLRGIVVPSCWDSRGKVTQVAICCPDEKEYRVRQEGLGRGLGDMIHLCVEVTGRLIPDGRGGQEILVSGFRKADSGIG
jgi:hypothetical protein